MWLLTVYREFLVTASSRLQDPPGTSDDSTKTRSAIVAVGFSENNTTGHVFIALARYSG
jgi:hypothetical protein